MRAEGAAGADALPQPLLQDAPPVLLRAAQQRAYDRRLGSLARFLCRGGHRHRHPGGGNGAAAPRPVEPGPRQDQRPRPGGGIHPAGPPGADGASHRHLGLAGGEDRHHPGHRQQGARPPGTARHRQGTDRPETQPPVQLRGLYRDHESRHGTAGQVGIQVLLQIPSVG